MPRFGRNDLLASRHVLPLVLVWGGVAAIMIATKISSVVLDEPVHLFTREAQTHLDAKWYTGAISNFGGVVWFSGATAAAFAWLATGWRDLRSPLLHAALILVLMGADDLFLLHEAVYSRVVDEKLIYAVYLALLVAFAVAHRRFLAAHGVLSLVPVTLAFFGVSTFMDTFYDEKQLIEDGTKLLGIGTLALLCFVIGLVCVREAAAGARVEPGA